ncbi:Phosphoglycolate phosphatase [Candidatus Nitrotoga sp. HW29]|uniref:phosphoglycolate phosphatase n=1 Tax=Candidatus Nitrotoga sp. HW29 TaxID=2886963 RepID=UPI001EF1BE65|nr:phosphoglycolate phosphatase [Candidatus Nitrotoga sp. HW29]CAH1903493.1 Phosphoglycolate phosphatase [Candidatus Nitrotoga sp. HW29]
MTSAVLFDLDGTFADTAPDLGAALNHLLSIHGKPPLPLEAIRPQASHGSAGLLKLGFNIEPDAPDFAELRSVFLDYYASHICVHTNLFPGMAELIETLEQHGLPWGIVTNKPHRFTLPLMQALGYAQRAACLISGDTCARAKPFPDPLLKASELLKIAPQHCLYLGDDKRDAEAAQAAGMRCIIARYGYISSPKELPSWPAQGGIDLPFQLLQYLTV